MKNIMYKFKLPAETLGTKCLCVTDVAVLIDSTIKNLEEFNSDSERMYNLIDSATFFAEKLGIDLESNFKLHHCKKISPLGWTKMQSLKLILPFTKNYLNVYFLYL